MSVRGTQEGKEVSDVVVKVLMGAMFVDGIAGRGGKLDLEFELGNAFGATMGGESSIHACGPT